jgi:hypothetical protein
MGVKNYIDIVKLVAPEAVSEAASAGGGKKKAKTPKGVKRADYNAFMRAARAGQWVLVDALIHLRCLLGLEWMNKSGDKYFCKGEDLIKKFYAYLSGYFVECAKRGLDDARIALLWDKSKFVNPGKKACQQARAAQRAKRNLVYYPDTVQYTLGGVLPAPDSVLQSIDIAQAIESGGAARVALRQFLIRGLLEKSDLLMWPPNTRLYIDSEEGCALLRPDDKTGRLVAVAAPPQYHNQMGEADIAALHWVRRWTEDAAELKANPVHETKVLTREEEEALADAMEDPTRDPTTVGLYRVAVQGIRLLTTDADWPMLHVYHQWPAKPAPAVTEPAPADGESKELALPPDKRHKATPPATLCVVWDNDNTVLDLSIPTFIEVLRTQYHFTRDVWLALCILFECDYFEKSWATAQVGHETLLEGVIRFLKATRYRDASGKPGRRPVHDLHGFRALLVHIYARKLGCPAKAEEVLAAKRPANMNLKLESDALAEAFVRFRLAYDYFAYARCWNPDRDPTQGGKVRVDVVAWLAALQI